MNYNFLCHIIRDIFLRKSNTLIYGDLKNSLKLREFMLSNEHSIGNFILHSDKDHQEYFDGTAYWNIGVNDPYVDYDFCDLFLSVNYNPVIEFNNMEHAAEQVKSLLNHGGHAVFINPGEWFSLVGNYLSLNEDLTQEAKKYSMLSSERVFIYENI